MEYFTIQSGGSGIRKIGKSGRSQKVSENVLNKAMQKGGGMMFNPKSGKVLMWPGMWSPSDIGKPDCGTPVVTRLVEPGEPVRSAIQEVIKPHTIVEPSKIDLPEQVKTKEKEVKPKLEQLRNEVSGVDKPGVNQWVLNNAKMSLAKYEKSVAQLTKVQKEKELDQLAKQMAQEYQETMAFVAQLKPELAVSVKKVVEAPIPKLERNQCEVILESKGYDKRASLGHGAHGAVLELCKEKDCKYVLKMEPYLPGQWTGFEREVDNYKRLQKLDPRGEVVVKMIDQWTCDLTDKARDQLKKLGVDPENSTKLGYIILDQMDESFEQKGTIIPDMLTKIVKQMDKLHKLRFVHYDPELRNIMFKAPNKILFVDLDHAWYFGDLDQNDPKNKRLILNMQAVDYYMLGLALHNAGLMNNEVGDELHKRFRQLYDQGWDYADTDTDYRGDSQYWNQPAVIFYHFADQELAGFEFQDFLQSEAQRTEDLEKRTHKFQLAAKHYPKPLKPLLAQIGTLQVLIKTAMNMGDDFSRVKVKQAIADITGYLNKWKNQLDKIDKALQEELKKKGQTKTELDTQILKDIFFGVQRLPKDYRDRCEQLLVEKEYKQGKLLATAKYGAVSEICKGYEDCLAGDYKYVIKMQPFSTRDTIYEDGFRKEVHLNEILKQRAPNENYYVKFLDSWDCQLSDAAKKQLNRHGIDTTGTNMLGITIMERWDETAKQLINKKQFSKEDMKKILQAIDKLHKNGLFHHDAHYGNFMYRGSGNNREWAVADLGQAWDFRSDKIDHQKGEWISVDPYKPSVRRTLPLSNLGTNLALDYFRMHDLTSRKAPDIYRDGELGKLFEQRYHQIRKDYNWDVVLNEENFYGFPNYYHFEMLVKGAHTLAFTPEDKKRRTQILRELNAGQLMVSQKLKSWASSKFDKNPGLSNKKSEVQNALDIIDAEIKIVKGTLSPRAYEASYKTGMLYIAEAEQLIKEIDAMLSRDEAQWDAEINGFIRGTETAITGLNLEITGLKSKVQNKPELLVRIQTIKTDKLDKLLQRVKALTKDDIPTKEVLVDMRSRANKQLAEISAELKKIEAEIPDTPPASRQRRASVVEGQKAQEQLKMRVDGLRSKIDQYNKYHQLPSLIDGEITELNKDVVAIEEMYQALISEDTVSGVGSLTKQLEAKLKDTEGIMSSFEQDFDIYAGDMYKDRTQRQNEILTRMDKLITKFIKNNFDSTTAKTLQKDIQAQLQKVSKVPKKPFNAMIKELDDIDNKITDLVIRRKALIGIKFLESTEERPWKEETQFKQIQQNVNDMEQGFGKDASELQGKVAEFKQWNQDKSIDQKQVDNLLRTVGTELSKIPANIKELRSITNHFIGLMKDKRSFAEDPVIKDDEGNEYVVTLNLIRSTVDETFEQLADAVQTANEAVKKLDEIKETYNRKEAEIATRMRLEQEALDKEIKEASRKAKQGVGTLKQSRANKIKSGKALDWDAIDAEEVVDALKSEFEQLHLEFNAMQPMLKQLIQFQESQKGAKGLWARLKAPVELPTDFTKLRLGIRQNISTILKLQVDVLTNEDMTGKEKQKLLTKYKKNLLELAAGVATLRAYRDIRRPFNINNLSERSVKNELSGKITESKKKAKEEIERKIKAAGIVASGTIRTLKTESTKARPTVSPATFQSPEPEVQEDFKIQRSIVHTHLSKVSLSSIKFDINKIRDVLSRNNISMQAFEGTVWFMILAKLFNLKIVEDGQTLCDFDCILEKQTRGIRARLSTKDADILVNFIGNMLFRVNPVKLSTKNPQFYNLIVVEGIEKINGLLKTKVTDVMRTRLTKLKSALEEEQQEAGKVAAVKRTESMAQLHEIMFPLVKDQKDIPGFIQFLEQQLNELKQLKKDNMEKKLVSKKVQTKIRNIVEKRILPSISTNNPGLFQADILYKPAGKGTSFTTGKPSKNYLLEIEKNLVNVYPLTIWLFDKEEADQNKSKIISDLEKLRSSNSQADTEINKSNQEFLYSLKRYIDEIIDKPEDLIKKDDKTIETILTQLGRLRTVVNSMPYSNERDKASSIVNTYFASLRSQNLQKINNILEGMLVNPMEGGSRRYSYAR